MVRVPGHPERNEEEGGVNYTYPLTMRVESEVPVYQSGTLNRYAKDSSLLFTTINQSHH